MRIASAVLWSAGALCVLIAIFTLLQLQALRLNYIQHLGRPEGALMYKDDDPDAQRAYNVVKRGVESDACLSKIRITDLSPFTHRVRGAPTDPDNFLCIDRLKPPCTVLSFGIAYDFDFDRVLLNRGCRVWSFDPDMKPGNYEINERHKFFRLGLGTADGDNVDPDSTYNRIGTYETKRFDTILKDMGVERVNVVRMDIEGAEWAVLDSMLLSDNPTIKFDQLLLEIHLDRNSALNMSTKARVLQRLHASMKLFYSIPNLWQPWHIFKDMNPVHELGFIAFSDGEQ